jgi:hypothetical protein
VREAGTHAWTHMLYIAAPTVRLRTVLELRDAQPTWIGCAGDLVSDAAQAPNDGSLTVGIPKEESHDCPHGPL